MNATKSKTKKIKSSKPITNTKSGKWKELEIGYSIGGINAGHNTRKNTLNKYLTCR